MITRPLLFTCLSLLLLAGCKPDDDSPNNEPTHYQPLFEVNQALHDLGETMVSYSEQGYSTNAALVAAANDLESDTNVTAVWQMDSSYVFITMSSGIEAVYALVPVDATGKPIYRGGGRGGQGSFKRLSISCSNEITNKKVLVFNAEFNSSINATTLLNKAKNKLGLDVEPLEKAECTYDVVKSFGNYGLVVINTHGLPNGFLLGTQLPTTVQNSVSSLDAFAEQFNSDASRSIADQILIDKAVGVAVTKQYDPNVPIHQQYYSDADTMSTWVSAKQIAQFNYSNTIIVGNMCYSGFNNTSALEASNIPILEGFSQANTKAYFGYQQTAGISFTVNSDFAEKMEERIYEGFFTDGDSTGSVHLDMSGAESSDPAYASATIPAIRNFGQLFFRQFFANDYCYDNPCGVLKDTRDGNTYRTLCIGGKRWMAQNLNYDAPGSYCYDNDAGNCATYGRLYSYTVLAGSNAPTSSTNPSGIQGVCPAGWHIPSYLEWKQLIDSVGGYAVAGKVLKSSYGWKFNENGTDDYNFTVLPAGQTFESPGTPFMFSNLTDIGSFFTCSYTPHTGGGDGVSIIAFYRSQDDAVLTEASYDPAFAVSGYSCRCVED